MNGRTLVLTIMVLALTSPPALARGGGGGGGSAAGGAAGANGAGPGNGPPSGVSVGDGRGTAISVPGSQHRSNTATERLSSPTPGKAIPPSRVTPGRGRVGTVPTTPGQAP
jgi:hypothetical protein